MDDRELETLFRQAPGEPPPATFDAADVAAASRRQAARRRTTLAVACSVAVLVLAGVGAVGLALNLGGPSGTSLNAVDAGRESAPAAQPQPPAERLPDTGSAEGFPDSSPKQGGDGSAEDGPRAGSTSGCKVDRELATALAGELPVADPAAAGPGRVCTAGTRSASLRLDGGTVSATVFPPGQRVAFAGQPEGTVIAERPSASGGLVVLMSMPAPGSGTPPHAADLDRVAATLAARY